MIRAKNPVAAGSTLMERSTARPGNVDMSIFGNREGAGQGAAGQGTVNENYQQQTEADNPEPNSQDEENSISLANCIITTALEELVIDQDFEFSVDVSASIGDASGTVTFKLFCTLTDADGNEECQDQSISWDAVISGGCAIGIGTLVSPKFPVPSGTTVKYHVEAEHTKAKESHGSSKVGVEAGKPPTPLAVWSLGSVHFGFDSSFVMPSAAADLVDLSQKMTEFSGAALAVFGHADPVGEDEDNKKLSGRRAFAIHCLLTRNASGWLQLSTEDNWDLRVTKTILAHLKNGADQPYYANTIDLNFGPVTKAAVKAFKRDNGLAANETLDSATLTKLYERYMDSICEPTCTTDDFVGDPSDSRLQWACSGCSEFNPLLVFSKADDTRFRNSTDKTARNAKNAPNRRATVALFPETAKGPGKVTFPCPDWKAGTGNCRAQFFDDAEARRKPTEEERTWELDEDTFACKFYADLLTEVAIIPPAEEPSEPAAPEEPAPVPVVPGKPIRFDAHCHIFNVSYLLNELKVMWKDPIISIGLALDAIEHYPDAFKGNGKVDKVVERPEKTKAEIAKDVIQQLEQLKIATFGSEKDGLDKVLDAAKDCLGGDYRFAAIPLMMDIYYMFTPPLTDKSTSLAAAYIAPITDPAKRFITRNARRTGGTGLAALAGSIVDEVVEEVGEQAMDVLGVSSEYLESPGFAAHRRSLEELKSRRPNELFPFFAVDPRRPGVVDHLLSGAIVGKDKPFQGVKLYPRLGVHPACKALDPVFKWCSDNSIPIVTHSSKGGFPPPHKGGHDFFGNPENFRGVLEKYPNLYINFAHFGGILDYNENDRGLGDWAESIISLMTPTNHVYADLSCVVEQDKLEYFKKTYWVRSDAAQQELVRKRTLFGTDYDVFFLVPPDWTAATNLTFEDYYKAFATSFTQEEMLDLTHTNPMKFLEGVFSEREPYAADSPGAPAGTLEKRETTTEDDVKSWTKKKVVEVEKKAEHVIGTVVGAENIQKGKALYKEGEKVVAAGLKNAHKIEATAKQAKETARALKKKANQAKKVANEAGHAIASTFRSFW